MGEQDSRATFAIDLEGNAVSVATQQTGALEALRKKLVDDQGALKGMQQAMRNLQAGGSLNVATFKKLRDEITAQKAKISESTEKYMKLGGSLSELGKVTKDAAGGQGQFMDAVRASGSPLGGMLERGRSLISTFGKAGVAGAYAAAAAAALILVTAILAATVALAKCGLEASNAARAERLQLEGMMAAQKWLPQLAWGYSRASGNAGELQGAINKVAAGVPASREQVAGYAQDLYKLGLRGAALTDALEAVSLSPEGYRDQIKGMVTNTAMFGGSVSKLTDTIRAKFGKIARAQMLDLNVQTAKLKEGIRQIFSGIKIEPFLAALHEILSLFSEQTATGRALKVVLESLLNPLFAGFAKLAPLGKRFFQGMVLAGLQFAIVVLTLRNRLIATFGAPKWLKGIDWMNVALKAGMVAGGAIVAVLVTLGAALVLVGVAMTQALAPLAFLFVATGAAIAAVVAGVAFLAAKIGEAWAFFTGHSWGEIFELIGKAAAGALIDAGLAVVGFLRELPARALALLAELPGAIGGMSGAFEDAGRNIVLGIARGITSAAGAALDAVRGLAKGVWSAFTEKLQMHSPSRLFFGGGLNIDRGVIGGVEAERGRVQEAVASVALPPAELPPRAASPAPLPAAIGASSAPSRVDIHDLIGEVHIGAHPSADPEDFAARVLEALQRRLDGLAIQMGARPWGATS